MKCFFLFIFSQKHEIYSSLEWSRTATHNHKSVMIATAPSASTLASRSSSVISDGTTSSGRFLLGALCLLKFGEQWCKRLCRWVTGSVFADSGISDGYSNDVILNEIHRQHLRLWLEDRVGGGACQHDLGHSQYYALDSHAPDKSKPWFLQRMQTSENTHMQQGHNTIKIFMYSVNVLLCIKGLIGAFDEEIER